MAVTILFHQIRNQSLNLQQYQKLICSSRLEQLQRRQPIDQLRSLAGDLLVLRALKVWGIAQKGPLRYERTENGKPFLPAHSGFHFNVSHSGDWVVCAASSHPIGVDIQQERTIKSTLIRHTLSKQEFSHLQRQPEIVRNSTFFDLWCLKEAYCKATGLGLRIPLRSINILLPQLELCNSDYQMRLLSPVQSGYHTGLCSQFPFPKFIPTIIITELLEE